MRATLSTFRPIFGTICVLICIGTWAMEWTGVVERCPFCQVQRTVIGILGLLLMLPDPSNVVSRYLGALFGGFAFMVASVQHFGGWQAISAGKFALTSPLYTDSFLLSGAALIILTAQIMLLNAGPDRADT
jgi:hypothetical protein